MDRAANFPLTHGVKKKIHNIRIAYLYDALYGLSEASAWRCRFRALSRELDLEYEGVLLRDLECDLERVRLRDQLLE